ncbi:PIN domain-containing protein [Halanaerobacter jeridensis]|uniref:Nucleic acid-binding protein n=1 Tax=Halanaerobacter jeridensis TaxID=706427 RepID=A0A939BQW7_9FIRM|nr:PIN domain-containing protein [Halanaerobacter jeridensis]MBM7556779.1 putative nucleic acid-binding protein [Halanaerobacter jeridensis]
MKKIIVDINVIMDLSLKREGFNMAEKTFDICLKDDIQGYVCAHEITILSYLLQRKFKLQKVKYFLEEILDIFQIISVNNKILKSALDSEIKDYEDAVIELSALETEVDYIITRNLKDFKNSRVEALSPEEFVLLYKEMICEK